MKEFKDIKIVGCLMVHTSPYAKQTVENLLKYTDELYINLNEPSEENKQFIINHPSVKKYIITENSNGKWIQSRERESVLKLLDDVRPDLILFPDDDEIFYH